jgi:hypothetical protein
MRGKKGIGMQEIVPAILMIVLAGIMLVFGMMMLDELLLDVSSDAVTVYNETETDVTNISAETCAFTTACGLNSFNIVRVTNATDGSLIDAGNYTITEDRTCTWQLTDLGNLSYGSSSFNVTYTYNFGNSTVCTDTNTTIEGLGDFADYVDLIVLGVIIAIVLSLILFAFSQRRTR